LKIDNVSKSAPYRISKQYLGQTPRQN